MTQIPHFVRKVVLSERSEESLCCLLSPFFKIQLKLPNLRHPPIFQFIFFHAFGTFGNSILVKM